MAEDTLNKRFAAKLATNLIGFVVGLGTQTLIARGLGPNDYGNFGFLTNFFTRITSFLDMGTSNGFYIKLSQRQNDFGLVSFYISFIGLASIFIFLFTAFIHISGFYSSLLPDQEVVFIYLALIFGIITWFVQILDKMADAYGLTVTKEIARIIQKIFGLLFILVLFFSNNLDLTHFFYYHYVILIFLIVAIVRILEKRGHSLRRTWKLSKSKMKDYINEFYAYGHPLFIYALIGLTVGILDRWMLQKFSGSIEQGFFWLSFKISAICLLFTGAMTQLIMREFAIAFERRNVPEMARLFRRYVPLLYSIAAFFSCFIALEATNITLIIGGEEFKNATLTVMIMSFYPIHQTYGHINSSVFYATNKTKLYRNIGGTINILRIPVTFFLIAPTEMMGLNTGSTGLAVVIVATTIINVNIQLFFNSRFLGLKIWRYLGHQIICVASLLICVFIAKFCVADLLGIHDNIIVNFFLAGLFYAVLVVALIYFRPEVFGLKRENIKTIMSYIRIRPK